MPLLTERQAQRLEAQFHETYSTFLERKFRKAMRADLDPLEAVSHVYKRFAHAIRRGDGVVLDFILKEANGILHASPRKQF